MLFKIAWRNVWRNKVRSFVVITAIALGLWAGIFASGFVNGMMKQKVDSVVKLELSHFQVHQPQFLDKFQTRLYIENGEQLKKELNKDERVLGVAGRVVSMGTLMSSRTTGQLKIIGIDPQEEQKVTGITQKLKEGHFLDPSEKKRALPIVISCRLADQYRVKLLSQLVFKLLNAKDSIVDGGFKVVGLYETDNNLYDKMNVLVNRDDLQRLLGLPGKYHELAVLLHQHELADSIANQYQKANKNLEIKSWLDLATGMRFMVEAMDTYTVIIVGIILVALLFSIINTMLMAVLERVREIGMLMAVGMAKQKVFSMIMLETIFLALVGGPLGLLISWASIKYFAAEGIHLKGAAYGEVGFASTVYPYLDSDQYVLVAIMVVVMAILAAVYPAIKALKLKPVDAIRKI